MTTRSKCDIDSRKTSKENWCGYNKSWEGRNEIPSNIRIVRAILKALPDLKGKKVLEVGSAMGRDGIYLATLGADVTLLDYIELPLQLAQTLAGNIGVSIKTVVADAANIPFSDGHFDLVFSQGLLEHFENPRNLVVEQLRVLKSDGVLIADVPQKYHVYTLAKKLLMLLNKWKPGWETQFSPRQIKRLVGDCEVYDKDIYGDWSIPFFPVKVILMLFGKRFKRPDMNYEESLSRRFMRQVHGSAYTFQHVGLICRKR